MPARYQQWALIHNLCKQLSFPAAAAYKRMPLAQFTQAIQNWAAAVKHVPDTTQPLKDAASQLEASVMAESLWYGEGKPYYNVHPQMFDKLSNINLSNIPLRLVEAPDNRAIWVLNFATDQHIVLDHADVLNVLLCKLQHRRYGYPGYMLVFRTQRTGESQLPTEADFNEYGPLIFCMHTVVIQLWETTPDVTVETAIFDAVTRAADTIKYTATPGDLATMTRCLKLIVSLGFLKNNSPELFEYDVLSKFEQEYRTANEERRQEIEELSKRRGKIGWNCGTDEMFLRQVWDAQPSPENAGTRELQWAHVRCGHPHAVRYGPGRGQVKVKWFRPTIVRPDKPFKAGEED